jgi:hypothetical protein
MAELMTISQRPAQLSEYTMSPRYADAIQARRVAGGENTTGLNRNPSDLRCGFSIVGAVSWISRAEDL